MPFIKRNDIPYGTAQGGACYTCGSGQRKLANGSLEPMVDSNLIIDQEGFLMFCSHCVMDMAAELDMLPAAKTRELEELTSAYRKENEQLRYQLSIKEDVITSLTRNKDLTPVPPVNEG